MHKFKYGRDDFLFKSDVAQGIKDAIKHPMGAKFYKCALQVNTFEYTKRHSKQSTFTSEGQYNSAMASACVAAKIDVVAITDHFRISSANSLATVLHDVGVTVFKGFEASTSEGVHLLCLFDKTTDDELQSYIGRCGVTDFSNASPQSNMNCDALMSCIRELGGLTIAAHICSDSGLLTTLKGQSRSRTWRSEDLLAVALPGPPSQAPEQFIRIINNQDPEYKRERNIAVINANDVCDPSGFESNVSTTWIKASNITLEALRQAFLDPESRIRLNSDPVAGSPTQLIALAWEGGLLDGQHLCLHESLNVLIGGRGSGKSSVIESIRYVLDCPAKGPESQRSHQAITKNVLGAGTKVTMLLHSPSPSPQFYIVERLYGAQPIIRSEDGSIFDGLHPRAVVGNLEIYGQHEISELTRQPAELTKVLRRFVVAKENSRGDNVALLENLTSSREDILRMTKEIERDEQSISVLPELRERLRRFSEVGLDRKLEVKTKINTEERLIKSADDALNEFSIRLKHLTDLSESYQDLIPSALLAELPNAAVLSELNNIIQRLAGHVGKVVGEIATAIGVAESEVDAVKESWGPLKEKAEREYKHVLLELQTLGQDGSKFIDVQGRIESLRPREESRDRNNAQLQTLLRDRSRLLLSWEELRAADLRALKAAAKRVSRRLGETVRVSVDVSNNIDALEIVLKQFCVGNYRQALERLKGCENLNMRDLAAAVRSGALNLVEKYGFTISAAEKIAAGGHELALHIEECELPCETCLELNTSARRGTATWKSLEKLSAGQKATALLLLLLLESESPLVIDQPEDDLDNHFIVDCVVDAIRKEKRRRQFILSSHNANIPVIGDSELIVGLRCDAQSGIDRATIDRGLCGSIDRPAIKRLVNELLEGGKAAFEYRRQKYGF